MVRGGCETEWEVSRLWALTAHITGLFSSVKTTSPLTWLPDVQSSTLRLCRGGFHHGVDAGKNTIDSGRVFIIYLTFGWCLACSFVDHLIWVCAFVRGSGDINAKATRRVPNCSGVSARSPASNTSSHHHQQHQAEGLAQTPASWMYTSLSADVFMSRVTQGTGVFWVGINSCVFNEC